MTNVPLPAKEGGKSFPQNYISNHTCTWLVPVAFS